MGTDYKLQQLALLLVKQSQPLDPHRFQEVLQAGGHSVQAVNETLFGLIRDGRVKRTSTGKLVLP
jgi:hypothetical protein